MTDHFYMRRVYATVEGGIYAYGDQTGSVTADPLAAYKRDWLAFEKRWREEEFGGYPSRKGNMFAYWRLPQRMPWHEALPLAQTTPPERVCVLTGPTGWGVVEFVLPPGRFVVIDQYPSTLPRSKR